MVDNPFQVALAFMGSRLLASFPMGPRSVAVTSTCAPRCAPRRGPGGPARASLTAALALGAQLAGCTVPLFGDQPYDAGLVLADALDDVPWNTRDAGVVTDAEVPGQDALPGADAAPIGIDRTPIPQLPAIAEAGRGDLRFKGGVVLRNELARALGLAPGQVASELGTTDSFVMHNIALRGAEPYVSGIVDPIENTSVSTPIVLERIALAACRTRVDDDLRTPANAVIFRSLTLDAQGRLAEPTGAAAREAVTQLYRRLLARDPEAYEVDVVLGLHGAAIATGEAQVGRAWAIMACFLVASSNEFAFF
jgi:hypothetical protein